MGVNENVQIAEADASQVARFTAIAKAVNSDESLVRRGRWMTADFIVRIGSTDCFVSIEKGRISAVETKPQIMRRSSFNIQAAPEDWDAFWVPFPKPGWHDIFAMVKSGRAKVSGDVHLLMCNLQYIKDVIAMPRKGAKGSVKGN
jgi:hypothetical protein